MTTIFWKQGISGNFATAADWSTDTVPNAFDDVFIVADGSYTVTASASRTIRTLSTASGVTLAVSAGTFTVKDGTGTGANAGTITVGGGAALAIGGTFSNSGRIDLDPTVSIITGGHPSDIFIISDTFLTGGGEIDLSADGLGGAILGKLPIQVPPRIPIPLRIRLPFGPAFTLTNVDNTITGAGLIGGPLRLVNEASIIGNAGRALTIATGLRPITNSGLIEATTTAGVVIDSPVENSGTLEALGAGGGARLELIDSTVTNSAQGSVSASGDGADVDLVKATIVGGSVSASGAGSHVDLFSAGIVGSSVAVDSGAMIQSLTHGGQSVISGAAITGFGSLIANDHSTLALTNSTLDTNLTLMSNGLGSLLSVDGTVGGIGGTINGGEIEFKGPSSANITFASGVVGTLKLDSSFAGTVSGFGHQALGFTNFFAFGDSTIDSGALQFLSPDLFNIPLTDRLQEALANGGTDSPVGVGSMNSQILAADFGLSANTAYTTGGVVGGGGTNYAISGALDAPDVRTARGVVDPGNGGISNINQFGQAHPSSALLSTVTQIETYLESAGGAADSSALYLISSGANDVSYAIKHITDPYQQKLYLATQAKKLAAEIETLSADGAQHILVNTVMNDRSLSRFYSDDLYADLNVSGIPYVKSDVHAMVQDVMANPTAYGYTSTTVQPGTAGTQFPTESALIEPAGNLSGWGLWGANTTAPDSSGVSAPEQYAYLSSPDAEQTHFFSDDQHLSASGQAIQASLDYNLVTDDAIDLTNLPYVFGATSASFLGTSSSGVLTVSAGTNSVSITLLGNYMASAFATASDGTGGTLVMDETNQGIPSLLQPALAAPH